MFHRRNDTVYMDLSVDLGDPDDWKVGTLRSFDYPRNITALATEPISRLLAIGTAEGSVYIFGGPGVETRLALPEPVGVKFVHFAVSTFQLVCMDVNSQLHIWDLSTYGRPDFVISVRFDTTNFLTLSPSHNHLFVSLNSGEIKTYDLACLRKSPYTIPNMWRLHEREMHAHGAPDISTPESCSIVETVIHPRDLNLIFVAYSGGVILSDLTKRHELRVFELLIPPGAPGGSGYGDRDLLTHRRPPVTAMAIHPTGHFLVVGHTDGSLAFWAVEDDERPLLVRTLEAIDVNILNMQTLDEHISQESHSKDAPIDREPIFKLSWSALSGSSDPRGGETTLTIFGGLRTNQATGITVYLFPAFNPPNPPEPTTAADQQLHPYLRAAMRNSLDHLKSFFYYTRGTVQDYLLIPREGPHFSGTADPMAIMLLTEADGDARAVEAYQYPPPEFSSPVDVEEDEENKGVPVEALGDILASTLRSMLISDEPKRLWLPSAVMNGSTGLLNGQLLTVETAIYQTLIDEGINDALYLPLRGGLAWADDTQKTELKLAKHQPHRLVITYHLNLTVQFHDISAQLLDGLNPTPIKSNFPNALPALTIDLNPLLMDTKVSKRTSPTILNHARIDSVSVAQELQEVAVVLRTGEVVVYRLSSLRMASPSGEAPHEPLLLLDHVLTQPEDRFSPHFMLAPGAGPVEACALSDLGFLAVAYSGQLYIMDTKGPHVLLHHAQDMSTKNRHSAGLHLGRSEPPPHIGSLLWTVSPLEEDGYLRIRLIAQYTSGRYGIYTLSPSGGSMLWICEGPISTDGVPNPLPQSSFVIDCKSGNKLKTSRARLGEPTRSTSFKDPHCVFVTCGSKGAKCFANINGTLIAKTDWGSKIGIVQGAQIVERLGSHVLVIFTDQYQAIIYSLPHLELLHTLSLPAVPSKPISMDESGDFMVWIPHSPSGTIERAIYCTLFDIRRVSVLPSIDFLCTKPVVPAQPQPVSIGPPSLLGSWLPFSQSMTGDQLDAMLGGPDRPLPNPERLMQSSTGTSSMATAATAAATHSTNLYNRLAATLSERGQLLGDLENRFNTLEEGSKSMVAQAKRLATQHTAKQTAKSWFG